MMMTLTIIYMMMKIKLVTFQIKKASEMRSHQRVNLVEPDCDDEKEVKMENLKVEIIKTYAQYINVNWDYKWEIKQKW